MLSLQSYASGSETESETENLDERAHLKPIANMEYSFSKNLTVASCPIVVPTGSANVERAVNPSDKELLYNPKYEELFTPVQGPSNPFLTDQQNDRHRNTLTGFVEEAHINDFQFENQRRTFHR